MAHRTRSNNLFLTEHGDNSECLMRGMAQKPSVESASSDESESRPPEHDEKTRSVFGQMTELSEQAGEEWDIEHLKSGSLARPFEPTTN